jgi:hypothetical protein
VEPTPTASQLLQAWERARSQPQVARALTLLALAAPAESAERLARYTIGRRDRELLDLRERIFGSRMMGSAKCPACGQAVEVEFSAGDIRADPAPDAEQVHLLERAGYEVRFRLPNCDDIASLEPVADASVRKSALLRRCVIEARQNGEPSPGGPLPEAMVAALSQRMAELDPQGDIQLSLACPICGHLWASSLDIVSFLWNEIHSWAGRMLRDIHALASAYGWREADILALSPRRRQAYLEIIRS